MKTTKKDFEIFENECLKWLGIFGLNDWYSVISQGKTIGESTPAQVTFSLNGRLAEFMLTDEWDAIYPKNEEEISRCAFHEVAHLLLADLERFIPSVNQVAWDTEIHRIVSVLENVLWANTEG